MFSTLIAYRKSLSKLNVNINLTTLQRRMKDLEYVMGVPKRKPLLSIVQRKRRAQCAREHVSRDLQVWKSIIFSDESNFLVPLDNGGKVWRKKGEESNPECIQKTVKYPASVMVWGA